MDSELLQGFYLGDLLIEPLQGRVSGPVGSSHLPPKAIEVLLCLAQSPGELVTRETLLECAWGDGGGSQEALGHSISELRRALGDHAENPRFVQTLPRRGYRLVITPVPKDAHTSSIVIGLQDGARTADIGILENLSRRGVIETGVAYLVCGWLLIQIADIVFAQLHLPEWSGTFVTVLVIAGFPIAILLSWFLEFRDGHAVLHKLSRSDARQRRVSRTYLSVVVALAIAAVFVFIYDQNIGLPEPASSATPAPGEQISLPPVRDNTIAVLPFLNIDGTDTTQIFANGLVDDVINRLARVPGLLVSARGDSHALMPNTPSQHVRDRLRVAMYLEGSVQMIGDEMRVIVQLIDSQTGFHILSRSFDRAREDFFDIRDEITNLTVANVRVALPLEKRMRSLQSESTPTLDAYLLYRRGVDAARSATSMHNIMSALRWFDEALGVDPDYAAAHAGKCAAFVNAFREIDDVSMIDKAESDCSMALELNPNLDMVHTALGQLYQSTGELAKAESSFTRALEIDPSSSDALVGLGEVYSVLNRPEDAEEKLREAIGLHPGDWSAYNRLGNFLFRHGRYTEAARQYQYVVALDHSNSNAYSNLGTAYMLSGDFTAALAAFEKSLEIEPKAVTYSNLGLMHYYLGQLQDSIEDHRNATKIEVNDHLTWSNLGDAMWNSGDTEGARSAFETARSLADDILRVNPNDAFIMMDLAWIHAMLGSEEKAESLMSRVLELAPNDPYTHYYNGLVDFRSNDIDGAIDALETAVQHGYPIALLGAEPHLAELHSNKRFLRLLSKN